jgi:hypothetical protein
MWEPQPLTTLRASKACRRENFTFTFTNNITFTLHFTVQSTKWNNVVFSCSYLSRRNYEYIAYEKELAKYWVTRLQLLQKRNLQPPVSANMSFAQQNSAGYEASIRVSNNAQTIVINWRNLTSSPTEHKLNEYAGKAVPCLIKHHGIKT